MARLLPCYDPVLAVQGPTARNLEIHASPAPAGKRQVSTRGYRVSGRWAHKQRCIDWRGRMSGETRTGTASMKAAADGCLARIRGV
jgi:hypothetical protein